MQLIPDSQAFDELNYGGTWITFTGPILITACQNLVGPLFI